MEITKTTASLFILLIIAGTGCTKSEPISDVKLPEHPDAINPNLIIDSPVKGAKALVYQIKVSFPATEITEYFDIEIKKLGFIKSPTESIGMFKWKSFNQKTGEWEETNKVPARYRATWVDPDKNMRIWLNLKYKKDSTNLNWEETLYVSCNIAENFD